MEESIAYPCEIARVLANEVSVGAGVDLIRDGAAGAMNEATETVGVARASMILNDEAKSATSDRNVLYRYIMFLNEMTRLKW